MELLQQEARTIAISSISNADANESIYQATTMPINHKNVQSEYRIRRLTSNDETLELKPFQNLPSREPIDIQFKDVSYYVNQGWKKGESINVQFQLTLSTSLYVLQGMECHSVLRYTYH